METQDTLDVTSASSRSVESIRVEPDLDFVQRLGKLCGESFAKCFQCGTCSATCTLSPDSAPFPRKEMAWANWGLKERLLRDPDVWLCYQCNDCSTRCPRDARPGDLLGAIRQECVTQYATPRFLARWVGQPQGIPLMLGIPTTLLTVALLLRDPVADALGISTEITSQIIYSYSAFFPHWFLNSFFLILSLLVLIVSVTGAVRFWGALKTGAPESANRSPAQSIPASIWTVLKKMFKHDDFTSCTDAHSRFWSHSAVFFGFLALSLVSIWVVTARYNPLITGDFVYPLAFLAPWKILANIGGLALIGGLFMMILERIRNSGKAGAGSYFDWTLIVTLVAVVATGFITEILHYVRLEPHRHLAYFVHLVFVTALILYLPYSKFAHLIYRTTALVYAEHTGRIAEVRTGPGAVTEDTQRKEE